jgi:hypothetical protein
MDYGSGSFSSFYDGKGKKNILICPEFVAILLLKLI